MRRAAPAPARSLAKSRKVLLRALAEKFNGPRPKLRLKVKCTGGSTDGLDFTADVSEIGNRVPALDVEVFAELDGVAGVCSRAHPP